MSATFKQGDTVYSEHGEEAEFIAQSMGEYFVRPIYEDDEYGPSSGEATTWKRVFRTPPKPKLDAETAAAEKRLSDLRAEIAELRTERYAFDNEERARKDRIKLHEELADLDNFLSGKVTHYVAIHDYRPDLEIISVDETLEGYSGYYNYGLLQLYPSRGYDKKIRWSVTYRDKNNRYNDSKTAKVIPCCGLEEAQAKAKEITEAMVNEYLSDEEKRSYPRELIANCKKYGIPVPQQITDDVNAAARKSLEYQLVDYQKKVDVCTAALAELTQEAA
jgi:hypothetical protein